MTRSIRNVSKIIRCCWTPKRNVEAKDSADGRTSLSWAVWTGHTEVVNVLLDEKIEAGAQSKNGSTALQCAAQNGHTEIVKP